MAVPVNTEPGVAEILEGVSVKKRTGVDDGICRVAGIAVAAVGSGDDELPGLISVL